MAVERQGIKPCPMASHRLPLEHRHIVELSSDYFGARSRRMCMNIRVYVHMRVAVPEGCHDKGTSAAQLIDLVSHGLERSAPP